MTESGIHGRFFEKPYSLLVRFTVFASTTQNSSKCSVQIRVEMRKEESAPPNTEAKSSVNSLITLDKI